LQDVVTADLPPDLLTSRSPLHNRHCQAAIKSVGSGVHIKRIDAQGVFPELFVGAGIF
jgi:hypothetical protein